MESINDVVSSLNGILFSDYTVYALLIVGVLFTGWSVFGQYRALTHGVQVIRGKYDDKADPGAINHFQALSAALSATVGLGNIAGVALAVALGGPGAILWMWLIGILGMALKMTEVTQSLLYRNTNDPENPHGGPMFVVKKGLTESRALRWPAALLFAVVALGLGYIGWDVTGHWIAPTIAGVLALVLIVLGATSGLMLGSFIGGVFVLTLITSAITGGNMFQAWNVADITQTNFQIPQVASGIVLTIVVGLVIIGGIKRIGSVAGRIVPFMCVLYVLAALYVLGLNIGAIPEMLLLIVKSGLPPFLGGEAPDATGAFLGGTFGYAAMWGVKRALFSSEAGQGSSPIAHSAAKTDEPVREGVVAGLEPFIDTIVVCTLTALVILSSGAYNREAEAVFGDTTPNIVFASETAGQLSGTIDAVEEEGGWTIQPLDAPSRTPRSTEREELEDGEQPPAWEDGEAVFVYVTAQPGERRRVLAGELVDNGGAMTIEFGSINAGEDEPPIDAVEVDRTVYHGGKPAWALDVTELPRMTTDARRIRLSEEGTAGWRADETIFVVVRADPNTDTGRDLRKLTGKARLVEIDDPESDDPDDVITDWRVDWTPLQSEMRPRFRETAEGERDLGLYADYAGASLTAYAFDRVTPGLGKYLVTIAAWLFAISTMISWSYYGEQGVYFLFSRMGEAGTKSVVLIYKLIYCLLILATTILAMPILTRDDGSAVAVIGNAEQLDMWTTLGLGVMLVANIPIMLLFGAKAMSAYRNYFDRMKHEGDDAHEAPPITDVVEGKDVE